MYTFQAISRKLASLKKGKRREKFNKEAEKVKNGKALCCHDGLIVWREKVTTHRNCGVHCSLLFA